MTNATRQPISRRTLLRGAGAALALPWLEGMLPRSAGAAELATGAAPVRMAVLYMPNGTHEDQWTPTGTGRDFELSPTLSPLADFKSELFIPSNLWNQATNLTEGHYVKTSGFLTCTTITKTLGVDLNCNGTSMDQLAAQRAGHLTPIPSLELAMHAVRAGVDRNVGYTQLYGSHIAWAGPRQPLAREIKPRLVYERLFRSTLPASERLQGEKLLLDRVLGDAQQLSKQLGLADRRRMDEYLQSVRAVEQQLDRAGTEHAANWKPRAEFQPSAQPEETDPKDYAKNTRLMLDMIALAFQTDTTRICTFMFGNAVSGQNFSFVDGVQGGHHEISHHQNKEDKLRQYQLIGKWHIEQYAYLLNKLRAMPEGESNVLHNSMILFGSGLRDGNKHSPHNLPLVLAGRAGGRLASGQHQVYSQDAQVADLYVSMLDAFGTPVDRFADSNGPLRGLLA